MLDVERIFIQMGRVINARMTITDDDVTTSNNPPTTLLKRIIIDQDIIQGQWIKKVVSIYCAPNSVACHILPSSPDF